MKKLLEFIDSKRGFHIISLVVLIISLLINSQTKPTYDEAIDRANGRASLNYFLTLGADTSFKAPYSKGWDMTFDNVRWYGVGFEIIPAVIYKAFPLSHEFLFRHLLNTILGFLSFYFIALILATVTNYRTANLLILLFLLSPTYLGYSALDTKDIPLAAGYSMALYYLVRTMQSLPELRIKSLIGLMLGVALSVSLRVAGAIVLLFIALFCLYTVFYTTRNAGLFLRVKFQKLLIIAMFCVAGFFLGLLFYPNFWKEGLVHIPESLSLVQELKAIYVLFEGRQIDSKTVPLYYIFKIFGITVPLLILTGFLLSLIFLTLKRGWKIEMILLLSNIIIPLILLLIGRSIFYNGWRHICFMYPLFCAFAALGWGYAFNHPGMTTRLAFISLFLLLMIRPVVWMTKNYKFSYAYYNLFKYNYKNIYGQYELDYYSTAVPESYDWLWEKKLSDIDKPVIVYSNNPVLLEYAEDTRKVNEFVTIRFHPFNAFSFRDWDYAILSPRLISHDRLKLFYPPRGTIHSVRLSRQTIAAVVERENKFDLEGLELLMRGDIQHGMENLVKAHQYNPNNYNLWFYLGYGYFMLGEYDQALGFLNNSLQYVPNMDAFLYIGVILFDQQQYNQAIPYLLNYSQAGRNQVNVAMALTRAGLSYLHLGNPEEAIRHLERSYSLNQNDQQTIYALYQSYSRIGNNERASYYMNRLNN